MTADNHPDRCETCGGSGIVGSPPDNYGGCPTCNPEESGHPDDMHDDRRWDDR